MNMEESRKTDNNIEEENEVKLKTSISIRNNRCVKNNPIISWRPWQGHDDFNQFNAIEKTCIKILGEVKPLGKITEYIECVDLPKWTQMVTQIATQMDWIILIFLN
jgi:hypothetical protein